jgi:uncharacterized protein (TIGR02246 family)
VVLQEWIMLTKRAATLKSYVRLLISIGAVSVSLAVGAQQAGQPLTPQDHVEIQELVARYSHALDSAADNGNMLAGLFTPDGVLTAEDGQVYTGRAKLAEYARATGRGALNVRHFSYKAIIDPSATGATGKTLVTFASIGKAGQPATELEGGRYWDEFVKTAEGWRIKKRTYVPGGRPTRQAQATTGR